MARVQVPIDAGMKHSLAHALAGTVAAAVSAAGSAQADATLITQDNNLITTASASQGVRLPSFNAGDIIIANGTAVTVLVYPVSGAKLNNDTANDPISLPAAGAVIIKALNATSYLAVYAPPAPPAMTAAEILAALLTVDGAGSGLDADLLDGQSSAFYATAASVPAAASQAEQETATEAAKYVAPATQQFHPSAAKAWASWDAAAVIKSSYNMASITDVGVGQWTPNIATDFSSAEYCQVYSTGHAAGVRFLFAGMANVQTAGAASTLVAVGDDGTGRDPTSPARAFAAFYGDQ